MGWDATVLGEPAWSPLERADRFAEFVELTDQLLRRPTSSYTGRYYSANDARTYPGCVQQPRIPFAIAATGPRAMKLAATFADTWVTTGNRAAETHLPSDEGARVVRAQVAMLEAACAQVGRDPDSIERLVLAGISLDSGLASAAAFADTIGRYEAVGVTDFVVHWPRAAGPFAGDVSSFEHIVSRPRGNP